MPSSFRTRQAGEGKVGCFVSLVVLIVGIAFAIKAGPVFYSNNELLSAIKNDIGPGASRARSDLPAEDLSAQVAVQIRDKAKELDIPEALKPGAIAVSVQTGGQDAPGNVHVALKYIRPVDFYGVYSYDFSTDETMDITIMTNIK